MRRVSPILRAIAILSIIAGATACSTSKSEAVRAQQIADGSGARNKQDPPASEPIGSGGVVLGTLANATLPTDACGMLIWMLEGATPTPVLRYVSGDAAQVAVAGEILELARIENSGDSKFGVYEKQRFTSGVGLTVDISVEFGTPFEGGAWLQNGLVAIESADGWRSVAPVAGVAGCRAK